MKPHVKKRSRDHEPEAFVIRHATPILRTVLAGAVLFSAMTARAEDGFAAILDVCEATTLDEAAARGGRLGWPAAPEDRNWGTGFERHNGGRVRVLGWRRSAREGDGLLSYWVASGPDAHAACALSTDAPGLMEALRDRFGAPDTLEALNEIVSAFWRRGDREVSFTRVGASRSLNLSHCG